MTKLLKTTGLVLALLLATALAAGAMTLKIATAAPEGSKWMREMRAGAEEIALRSSGRVQIKYFAGGVMGNDKSVMRKIRVGQLHGGAFIAGSLEEIDKDINLYSLPLVFRSYDEVDYVRRQMDGILMRRLEEAGFASFGFAEGGFAYIMSPKPLRTIEDAHGLKIWVPEGDRVSYRAMESLGLSPVTLPITDVMTGLQARLIEVIVSSPIGALAFQWHTKINYVTETPLSYLYASLVIDKRFFDRLLPADQELVREVMGRIYAELDRFNREDNQMAVSAMKRQGIEFIEVTDDELKRWRGITSDLNRQLAEEGFFSRDLYQQMLDHLHALRSGQAAPSKN